MTPCELSILWWFSWTWQNTYAGNIAPNSKFLQLFYSHNVHNFVRSNKYIKHLTILDQITWQLGFIFLGEGGGKFCKNWYWFWSFMIPLWPPERKYVQQNSYVFVSHLLGTVTTLWLDGDCVVTVDNCRQSGDWAANVSVVTALPAVVNSRYTVTVQSQCSDCV